MPPVTTALAAPLHKGAQAVLVVVTFALNNTVDPNTLIVRVTEQPKLSLAVTL